ncbi:lipoprotein [Sinorhizobium sp. BG8]|uniref:LPS translocon maturation chaperone LptM n=1 Tax=Sinorhizobium sp. BG8 TaxID=2613773 RepID=UPI00193CA014|nr:lipoprotein [Sinorhizobium sp. BG8]QRM53383.1 lipoprotein [Sinorhizobium sp. BG8]
MILKDIGRLTLALALMGVLVAGCGRKGDLEPPGRAPLAKQDSGMSKNKKQPVEDRPFFLDPLL